MPRLSRVAPDAAIHELEYAVVDVETTGGGKGTGDRVTEIAAVIVRGGRTVDTYSSLVNPLRPIPAPITRLTGISNAMVLDAPRFSDVAGAMHAMLGSRVFVAHNVGFDWSILSDEFFHATGRPLAGDRLCTVKLARRLLSHLPKRNLDAVAAHYDVRITQRHRALGDAQATADVFTRMLDELGRQGVHTWRDLDHFLKGKMKKRKRPSALPHAMTDWSIA